MHPTLEKVAKKVSRACNTCRLKRKKCDGLDPCAFCVDNKLECLYSKEPRRRGPPSGYLRYTETRVAILEILLGLYISKLPKEHGEDPFLETAKTLQSEAKICTQDVWDAHKARWTRDCPSSQIVEQLVVSFAPFTPRSNQEASVKTLLPTLNTVSSGWAVPHRHSAAISAAAQDEEDVSNANDKSQPCASQVVTQTLRPSSSETADDHDKLEDAAMSTQPEAPSMSGITSVEQQGQGWQENAPIYVPGLEPSSSIVQLAYPQPYRQDAIQLPGVGLEDGLGLALGLEDSQSYTGSYWRTADLAPPEIENNLPISLDQRNLIPSASTNQIDLPPIHILSQLLDVYYQHVHPSYPILPCRTSVDAIIMSPSDKSDIWSTLMLSACAYSGRLSVPANRTSISTGMGGLAGIIAADLWYEQARTSLSALLKKESSLELVQATLFLALRDYGKGSSSQAWVLVGLAVRMGQDLQLHEELNNNSVLHSTTPDSQLRQNIWGVSLILDLLLSLQMSRPPATFDSLKASFNSIPRPCPLDVDLDPSPPFAYALSLCRIISMINFHLYLGYPLPAAPSPPEKLLHLRTELNMWHHSLPVQYRISIGHQPRREVLEINMLYHVAIILLYQPISKEQLSREVVDIFLEAASSFSVLLEKYWRSQITTTPLDPGPSPILSYTSPNMIYFIYTAATAHLSGYKIRQRNGISPSTSSTSALQTQLHLLKCLEALSLIGYTWELARRCWKALDTFMEIEHLKPKPGESLDETNNSHMLGKRKREIEAQQKRTWQSQGGMIGSLATSRGSAGSPPDYLPSSSLSPPAPAQNSAYIYPNVNSPLSDPTGVITPSPNSTPQFMSGGTRPPSMASIGVSGWEDPMLISTTNEDLAMFDPLLSAKWVSDTSQALSTEWNNPWSEEDFRQSCLNGMVLF